MLKVLFLFGYFYGIVKNLPPSYYTIDLTSTKYTAVTITNNVDPSACTCDKTYEFCDNFCCCDLDCNTEIRTQWTDNDVCNTSTVADITNMFQCSDYEDRYLTTPNAIFDYEDKKVFRLVR